MTSNLSPARVSPVRLSPVRRWAYRITAVAGVALVLGSGTVAANAVTPSTVSSTVADETPTCSFGEHLVSAWMTVPVALRHDLTAVKAMGPGAERRAAAKGIVQTALDGGYGERAREKAELFVANKGSRIRNLPADLKADLRELRAAPRDEKVALAEDIAGAALDGTYGETVQEYAEKVQASDAWQDCVPR